MVKLAYMEKFNGEVLLVTGKFNALKDECNQCIIQQARVCANHFVLSLWLRIMTLLVQSAWWSRAFDVLVENPDLGANFVDRIKGGRPLATFASDLALCFLVLVELLTADKAQIKGETAARQTFANRFLPALTNRFPLMVLNCC